MRSCGTRANRLAGEADALIGTDGERISGRFKLSWSGSSVKWVAIEDTSTGIKAIGRDNASFEAALASAKAEMRRRLRPRASAESLGSDYSKRQIRLKSRSSMSAPPTT